MKKMFLLACMALLVSACEKDPDVGDLEANLAVYTDYDNDVDFGAFKTYFLPDSILEAGSHHASYWKDENALAIISEVESQMESRGYTRITDPEKMDEANVGVQLSYISQTTHVVTGGYFGGWWDYSFWGPWSGWYYPYPVSYSYDTNTLVMEMVDLTATGDDGTQKLPVVWYADASGFDFGGRYNLHLLEEAVVQAFSQSPYIKSANK